MTKIEIEELLWKRRDGELGKEEEALLERLLAESEEARELARQVEELEERLEALAESKLPVELRSRIDSALSEAVNRPRARVVSAPRSVRRRWMFAPLYRYAALAAALVVAVLGGWIITSRQPSTRDESRYVGTMENPPAAAISSQSFDLGEKLGKVSVRRRAKQVVFDLILEKKAKVELDLTLTDEAGGGINLVRFGGSGETAPRTGPAALSWNVEGPGTFSLTVAPRPSGADLSLTVLHSGRQVLETTVRGAH